MSTARANTAEMVKFVVWVRAAGHCELCSSDLTRDLITLSWARLGEVAHILPASSKGPRGGQGYSGRDAEELTDDPANLMLLCRSCHGAIDKTPEGYPAEDLTNRHEAFLERVTLAANTAHIDTGAGLIVLGHHFRTNNRIEPSQLQRAMWSEGVRPLRLPLVVDLPAPDDGGRDDAYYDRVRGMLTDKIERELNHARGLLGDAPWVGVAGLADIPSLMILGSVLGDRCRRRIYSPNRHTGLDWPNAHATAPVFLFDEASSIDPNKPIALVISISAQVADRDVLGALPDAQVFRFSIDEPHYDFVQNAAHISEFSRHIQRRLSQLEASTNLPIHVFPVIPAALAVEFGALLSTNHQHGYWIYDRSHSTSDFKAHLFLGHPVKEKAA